MCDQDFLKNNVIKSMVMGVWMFHNLENTHGVVRSLWVQTLLYFIPILLLPLVLFIKKNSSIFLSFSKGDCNGHWRLWFLKIPLLGLLMHFLCWWSSFWSIMIVIFMNLFLGVVDAHTMLIIFFLVNGDCDVHKLFS